jgi:DNA invertase Pin-like site-specific DNA recombinase
MVLVGYARVSTRDQHPEAQLDALSSAGCERTFTDQASGTLARRPALDEALSYLRAGDTLVVTKLDRLGRSMRNLKQIADTFGVSRPTIYRHLAERAAAAGTAK